MQFTIVAAILTILFVSTGTNLQAADRGKCPVVGELAFLGVINEGSADEQSMWLSTYVSGGAATEPFRLEPAQNSPWSDSFSLPISGMHTSASPVVSPGSGGAHRLFATSNDYNNCNPPIAVQNQKPPTIEPEPVEPPIGIIPPPEPTDPEPVEPPIGILPPPDPTDPEPVEPPIGIVPPPDPVDPVEPVDPPDPNKPTEPVEPPPDPGQPSETGTTEAQKPSGDQLVEGILITLSSGLNTTARERSYSISDRIVTGLVGRTAIDRIRSAGSPASFRQNLLGFLREKQSVSALSQRVPDEMTFEEVDRRFDDMTLTMDLDAANQRPADPTAGSTDAVMEPEYNLWADGQYYSITDDRYDIDASGSIREARFGIDKLFSEDLIVGMAGGLEKLDNDAYGNTVSVEQDDFFIGPYLGYRFNETAVFDLWAGYSNGDGESRISTLEGNFDLERLFISANLSGQYTTENLYNFRSKLAFYYGHTEISDYELYAAPEKNNGVGGTLSFKDASWNLGVLELIGEVNKLYESSENTYAMPFLRLGVSWAFERPNDGVILTPELTEEDTSDVLGNVHTGVRVLISEQFVTEVRVGYFGIGESDLDIWDGRLMFNYFF